MASLDKGRIEAYAYPYLENHEERATKTLVVDRPKKVLPKQ